MNITPLKDRALLRPIPEPEGRIIKPETAQQPDQIRAQVVALGGRSDSFDWPIKVGQTVYVTEYMGAEVMMGQTKHLVMREKDIHAIIE